MRNIDLYAATVTAVPFLLWSAVSDTIKVFGPASTKGEKGRRSDAAFDIFALLFLASAFTISVVELVRDRDDDLARVFAGWGLGLGALVVFGHAAMEIAELYRSQPEQPPTGILGTIEGMTFLAAGEIVVVETDDDQFLGTAEVVGEHLVIRPGHVGRPALVSLQDVVRVTPASEHQDVD